MIVLRSVSRPLLLANRHASSKPPANKGNSLLNKIHAALTVPIWQPDLKKKKQINLLENETYDLSNMDIPEQSLPPDELFSGDVRLAEIGFKLKGIVDPFDAAMKPMVAGLTPDVPNLIPTFEAHRTVACLCSEENFHFNYMVIWEGELVQCKCGWWFQAVRLFEDMRTDQVPKDLINQMESQNCIMAAAEVEDFDEQHGSH